MRNWDRLLDLYMEQYAARGIIAATVANVRRELERLGCWLKNRRPRPSVEEVGSDLLVDYLRSRASWRSKATLSGAMSKIRGFGEFLVLQGTWLSNPLRWMKGPKLRMYDKVPRRLGTKAQQDPGRQIRLGWQSPVARLRGKKSGRNPRIGNAACTARRAHRA